MRILVVSNYYPPHFIGGYEIACRAVAEGLRQRGHDVFVLTSDYGVRGGAAPETGIERSLRAVPDWQGPRSWRRKAASLLFQGRNHARLRDAIERLRPEVLYAWNLRGLGALDILASARRRGIPLVTHNMDYWLSTLCRTRGFARRRPLRRALASVVRRRYAGGTHICMSRVVASEFEDAGFRPDELALVYHGLEYADVPQKASYGASEPFHVCFAGQILNVKGVDLLLRAVLLLREAGQDVRATYYGDGPDLAGLRHDCERFRLGDRVSFTGFVENAALLQQLERHDAFVFMTHDREPFGFVVLEAMSAGLPVVAGDRGGCAEILVDGLNCLQAQRSPAGVAAAIHRLKADPALARAIGTRGAALVRARFTLGRELDEVEAILEGAVRPREITHVALPDRSASACATAPIEAPQET
jgi:glycosyltransferase involved in cell wall biosynthesis